MKTKKWISMIAAGAMAISMLAGCGASNTASVRNEETQTVENAAETEKSPEGTVATAESEGSEREKTQGGKTLVVYYSASGHTEGVANTIAEATGADLFELEPAQPYSSADLKYSDDNSRVSQEHENEDLRDVELAAATVEDWDSYETVFIGYPIWWGIAAWPVDGFVEENDFTGKTVIPFCTSASSGLGESGELLEKKAGTGNWMEGIRFSSGVSEETVQEWVKSLGL
ncbi:flavodoxin [[Clostridium] symbiosum]|uniref:flavodoxin n=1 Tax=Clostridium symbiosum TaxID=1512 RepID=UPI0032C1AF32